LPVGPNSGILRTQVYELLKEIAKNCTIPTIIRWICFVKKDAFEKNIEEFQKLILDMLNFNINLKVVTLSTFIRMFRYLKPIFFLFKEVLRFSPDIIHCRSYPSNLFALITKVFSGSKSKIVFDPRGVYPEETRQIHNWKSSSLNYKLLKYLEVYFLKKSDVIICVSKTLENHYKSLWGQGNFLFVPPCVEYQRFNFGTDVKRIVRNKYSIPIDSLILLYSGKFDSPWCMSYECGEIINKIRMSYPKTHLVVLSNSKIEKIRYILLRAGVEEKYLRIISPYYEDIPILTNAADIGLIVREESIINKVAFPIKFLEYLASGLPVIVTKANLFISQIVEKEKIGLIYSAEDNDFLWKLEELLNSEIRLRCKNFSNNYDLAEISKKYLDIYIKTAGY
jgi:glycosyltransferase involved in cell wall biosynthesis